MLTYLDSLCDSMTARDLPRLRSLVEDHPMARVLPADAMAEVRHFLAGKMSVHAVPLMTMRFRDQTARLLSDLPRPESAGAEPADEPTAPAQSRASRGRGRRRRVSQMELPLSA